MTSPARSDLVTGHRTGPVPTLSPTAGVVVAVVAVLLSLLAAAVPTPAVVPLLAATGQVAVLANAAVLLHRRGQRPSHDAETWTWLSRGTVLLGAAAALRGVSDVVAVPAVVAVTTGALVIIATVLLYRGAVLWNRWQSGTSDPRHWLNGVSSIFVVAAAANLAATWRPSDVDAPWWLTQVVALRLSAVFVLAAALVAMAIIDARSRDPRLGLAAVTAVAVLVLDVAEVAAHSGLATGHLPAVGWTVAAALLARAAVSRRAARDLRTVTTRSLTFEAFEVLLASVAVLTVTAWVDAERTGVILVLCGLAIAGVCANLVQLVRDLEHFATVRQEARTDELTQLANRRSFVRELDQAVSGGAGLALLVIDLDRFKEVNDRYGHAAGDEVLRQCATLLRENLPERAVAARLGGDEFAALLPGATHAQAVEVARRIASLSSLALQVGPEQVRVGASVGVALTAGAAITSAELLRQADTAMYLAKTSAVGAAVYDDDADRAARERTLLALELADALGPGPGTAGAEQFVVHYQPQVSLPTGDVVGVEALVRWEHPRLGLLTPDRFLALLEERGHMSRLTAHVLGVAARQLQSWREEGLHLRLAVNLSASCLTDPGLLPVLDELIAATELDPSDLVLEVTETTLMADTVTALTTCREIADRGIGLSIDDYGTGYSSLSYLGDLPASELKLDRSFTARAVGDERIAAIIAGTVTLGHHLGLRVVAEGVEDLATLDLLRSLGCDETQGFLHSRAVPPAELAAHVGLRTDMLPLAHA